MKKFLKVISLSIAAIAFFSCEKEASIQESPVSDNVKVVKFSTTPITKTVFGTPSGNTLPTLWTANHGVALSLNLGSTKESSTPAVADGGVTANFEVELEDDKSGDYSFYAVSPYEAVVSINSNYKSVLVNFPTAQTPTATSPDELAQILYGKYAAGSTFPASVTMDFEHLSAYGKISFSNLSLAEGETIASVSLTAAENWAGRYYYYAENHDTFSKGDFAANSASKTITIHTTSATDIWFGCAPVDLGGKKVDVVITTNTGSTYSKTITIPAGKAFTSGKVNAFTINMNGITSDDAVVYTLVENVADLSADSKVIIVAADADVAISTTQNNNNRGQAAIIKSGKTISSPGADVQIFTLKAGTTSGTWAFYTGTGYIYAASSEKNNLRTEETLSANSSWAITISGGATSVVAAGTNTRNTLQYNSNNTVFSCYGSASQGAVAIYKEGSGSSTPVTPVATTISLTKGETSSDPIEVSAGNTVDLSTYVTTNNTAGVQTYTSSVASSIATLSGSVVTGVAEGGPFEVVLNIAASEGFEASEAKTIYVTVTAAQTLVAGSESFDLSKKTYTAGTNEVTWDGNSVTIHNSGNNAANYLGGDANNRTSSRFYSGNELVITPKSGYTITSIVFTATTNNFATELKESQWSNATVSANGTTVTVTPTKGSTPISATIGGTCGFTRIVVNYMSASGSGSGGEDGSTQVNFTPSDFDGQGTSGTGSSVSATKNGVTVSSDKGYGTTQFRVYSEGKLTISAGTNTITDIAFTFSGSYNGGLEESYTNVNASSKEFTLSSQARIMSITVTYE